jgi:altronate dehydratase small subunit
MSVAALVLKIKDNVATAVRPLNHGDSIDVAVGESVVNVVLLQAIPFGHKFALEDIERGGQIVKYGEKIGRATVRIEKGEHVHVHNVEGLRGRGDIP